MSNDEDLIRAVEQLSLEVRGMSKRLENLEDQVGEIGGGLAVVLNRSSDTKKKLPTSLKRPSNLSSISENDFVRTTAVLRNWRVQQQSLGK